MSCQTRLPLPTTRHWKPCRDAWERRQPDSGLLASDDYMTAQAALGMLETLLTTEDGRVSRHYRPR